ncbi:IS3 family transposase [Rudanella paleaurantiibacter]|uniref:IS3 family transposase n=3 Tax=Rudanella paleaurantiibacter TaxID=2614655 RepID=A0A7J5TS88_9BACT|nr:IS3 family transposase [Rudanella paleaurantiibacter]
MKANRFTESQMVAILKQQDNGQTVAQISREHGISEATFYAWKTKFGGMQASDIKRIKELEEENRRLKKMYADLSLQHDVTKEALTKKLVNPTERRALVRWMMEEKQVSQRKACRWVGLSRNAVQEPVAVNEKDAALKEQIETLAKRHKQWGVLKIYRRLRKQGECVNHKRVRRLYRLSGLNLRRKSRKRLPEAVRKPLVQAQACNECWSMDFTSDSLTDGRKFRTLNVLDDYNREALGIEIDFSLPAKRVTRLLDRLVDERGKPQRLRSDNGPEFIADELQAWCQTNEVELVRIQPGKPTQNAYIERFNGTFRREVLNPNLFSSVQQARRVVDEWLVEYNTERPHQALRFMTPVEYRQAA